MPLTHRLSSILGLWLTSVMLPIACKTPEQGQVQETSAASRTPPPENRYVAIDLRHLHWIIANKEKNCTNLNPTVDWTPSAIIGRLYQFGLEKPPSPKAELGHQSLQRGGYMALRRAFFIATSDDIQVRENCQRELAQLLDAWSQFPAKCFAFDKSCPYLLRQPSPDTSNRSLELTWLLSNLIRAATILEDFPPQDPRIDVAEISARFKIWAGEVLDTYINYEVFAAGNSNRKASQIETLLRYGILTKNAAVVAAQKMSFETLLREIKSRGELCEDTLRDKFHPQFLIASALNIEALIRNKTSLKFQDPPLPVRMSKCPPMDVPYQVDPDDEEQDEMPEREEAIREPDTLLSLRPQDTDMPPLPKNAEINAFSTLDNTPTVNRCTFPPQLPACRLASGKSGSRQAADMTSLATAIAYVAESNLTEAPPRGYESPIYRTNPPQNWRPAYNIPTWYLAARYFIQSGQDIPPAVQCMLEANYLKFNCSGRYDFNKSWGYSAIADRFGL